MDDTSLRDLSNALSQVLRPHLERSESLRRTVALVGKWLTEEATRAATEEASMPDASHQEGVDSGSTPVSAGPSVDARDSAPAFAAAERPASAPEPLAVENSTALVPLRLGNAIVQVQTKGTVEELGRAIQSGTEPMANIARLSDGVCDRLEADLRLIERRCRLKATSCRHFAKKRAAAEGTGAAYTARHGMDQLLAEAKAMQSCFLWVFWRDRSQPDDVTLATIAENYDAHADAVALVRQLSEEGPEQPGEMAEALQLLAQANSALRVALSNTWLTEDDRDQYEVHVWLRDTTASRRVFLDRHMTSDDPANPAEATALRARVKKISNRMDDRAARTKGIKSSLSQIKFHAGQIVKNRTDGALGHWKRIAEAVSKLRELGVPSSDRRITDAVDPRAAEWLPAEALALRGLPEIVTRVRALNPASVHDTDDAVPSERDWSKAVYEVRELLRGTRAVVIGGEPNGVAAGRLVDAFELSDAEWVSLSEHGPGEPMRAPIFRSDTGIVLVIIKLTGHLHADEASAYASAADKPCVFLTGGYNPERVAKAVLEQASVRLRT